MSADPYLERKKASRPFSLRFEKEDAASEPLSPRERTGQFLTLLATIFVFYLPFLMITVSTIILNRAPNILVLLVPIAGIPFCFLGLIKSRSKSLALITLLAAVFFVVTQIACHLAPTADVYDMGEPTLLSRDYFEDIEEL